MIKNNTWICSKCGRGMYCLDETKICPVCNFPFGNYKGCNPIKVEEKTDEQEKQEREVAWKLLNEIKNNKPSNKV